VTPELKNTFPRRLLCVVQVFTAWILAEVCLVFAVYSSQRRIFSSYRFQTGTR